MRSCFSHIQLFETLRTVSARLPCPRDSPGQNTGMGCHALLQGIFLTQGRTYFSYVSCIGRWVLYDKGSLSLYKFTHMHTHIYICDQVSSVAQLCPTLGDPMDCSTTGFPSITNSRSWLKLMSIESVMPPNDLILCVPPLLLPSVFPSIRVFSNESILLIKWPKYWSLRFSLIKYICMCKQIYLFIDCATEVTLKRASG